MEEPVAELKRPAAQIVQFVADVEPVDGLSVPLGQSVQFVDPL